MDVMVLIAGLAVLTLLLWAGYHVTGALLSAVVWLFIRLPLALIIGCFGVVFCASLILIPLGLACFKGAFRIAT